MALAGGCNRSHSSGTSNESSSEIAQLHEAVHAQAGKEEHALLDGLRIGETVEGFEVVGLGAVRADGAIEIRLEANEQAHGRAIKRSMRLAVALNSDEPLPPVRTEKYALYYEGTTIPNPATPNPASEQQCLAVLEAIAIRIRRVEADVPVPKGLGRLGPVGTPM